MKIGIMGGTFDPIHNGHLMLAEYAARQCMLDEVWFMPNGHPPHKEADSIEATTEDRVTMTKLAIKDHKLFKLCLLEVERTEISYSYESMRVLKEDYPNHDFYFIIGADSLFAIERWVKPEILLKQCRVLAAYRDGKGTTDMLSQIAYLNRKYEARISLLKTPMVEISSSEIRKRIKSGQEISEMLPEEVAQYIREKQLFEGVKNEQI